MRKFVPAVAAAVIVIAPAFAPMAAQAAPERIKGERCKPSSAKAGTWVGFFDGYEDDFDLFRMRDSRRSITVWRCFKSKADCNAWKYWMQTDYDAGPKLTWCRKK